MRHPRLRSGATRPGLVLAITLTVLATLSLPAAARQTEGDGTEIVGGVLADAGEYPFIVSVIIDNSSLCGGSLLTPTRVLTAAHCVDDAVPSTIAVRVGSNSFTSGGTVISAVRKHVHRGWNPNNNDNDLAVLDLATPAVLSPTVATVRVPRPALGVGSAGTPVTVAGWGTTSAGGSVSDALREVSFAVLANSGCAAYGTSFHPSKMLCAGVVAGGADSCQGDSGGPLFADRTSGPAQVGIVSWGTGCAQPNFPGVYTRLSTYAANNDGFGAATILPRLGGSATSRTYTAIRQTGEPRHAANNPGGASVWFRWTAPARGRVTISTVGSNFDTLLGVYRGAAVTGLTRVAGNDDASATTRQSRVTFTALRNVTYRIAVDGWNGDIGNVKVNVRRG